MSFQEINVGTVANDTNGDGLRTAMQKVNANFADVWEKLGGDYVTPSMYGGVIDDTDFDSSSAIEAAFAASQNVLFDGIYYVGNSGVTIDAAGCLYAINPRCGVRAMDGASGGSNGLINLTASGVKVLGLLVDGRDLFRRGVYDTAGGNTVNWCDIKNLYSTTASAVGIEASSTTGSTYQDNTISEVESVGDMSTGNDNGAARAIRVATSAAITSPYRIEGNDISRIIGEEGDGIQVVCHNAGTFYSSGRSVVADNTIRKCSKRGIKIQAHLTSVVSNTVLMLEDLGADAQNGIDIIDAQDVYVNGNRVEVTSTLRGINVSATASAAAKRPVVTNNKIRTSTSIAANGISVNESEDAVVHGNTVEYGNIGISNCAGGYISGNTGINLIANSTTGFIQSASTGSGLVIHANAVLSGDMYAVVNLQGADNIITENAQKAGNYRCIFVAGSSALTNIIKNNHSVATSVDAVAYSTATEAGQRHVFGNRNSATQGLASRTITAEINAPHLFGGSGAAIAHTGTTDETTLATVTIPGGALGANGTIHVHAVWTYTNSANNKTMRVRLGGIGGNLFRALTATTTATFMDEVVIMNRNSASSQVGKVSATASPLGTSTTAPATGTQNTANDTDLVLTAQLADTGETITLEWYQVFITYRA